jgi:single stranded DNA-binding protein
MHAMAFDRSAAPSEADREADQVWRDAGPHPADRRPGDGPDPVRDPGGSTKLIGSGSLSGTLCADPEMRFTQTGKALTKLRVAVSRRVQDPDTKKWSDGPAEYTDVTVWGGQAERCMEALRRGDRIVVSGMWQEDTWLGRDEQWHSKRSLKAADIGPSLMFKQVTVHRPKERG